MRKSKFKSIFSDQKCFLHQHKHTIYSMNDEREKKYNRNAVKRVEYYKLNT